MRADCRVSPPEAYQVDTRPDVEVARRAARQWGVLSAEELRACGLPKTAISVRARSGHLHPLYRGVYAVGHDNPPLEGRFLAAVKACGAWALLSHFAAAAHVGMVRWDPRSPEVTVVGTRVRVPPGIRVHRTD